MIIILCSLSFTFLSKKLYEKWANVVISLKDNTNIKYEKKVKYSNNFMVGHILLNDNENVDEWVDSFKLLNDSCVVISDMNINMLEFIPISENIQFWFKSDKDFVFWTLKADKELIERLTNA